MHSISLDMHLETPLELERNSEVTMVLIVRPGHKKNEKYWLRRSGSRRQRKHEVLKSEKKKAMNPFHDDIAAAQIVQTRVFPHISS